MDVTKGTGDAIVPPASQSAERKFWERMLPFFEYEHLPETLQPFSRPFLGVATELCELLPPGPERTVMLRKLLEAKDCAVRAALEAKLG